MLLLVIRTDKYSGRETCLHPSYCTLTAMGVSDLLEIYSSSSSSSPSLQKSSVQLMLVWDTAHCAAQRSVASVVMTISIV